MRLTHEQLDRVQVAFRLSPREREIVDLLFQGVTTDAGLAERLGITVGTTKNLVHALLLKTNCPDKVTLTVRLFYALTREKKVASDKNKLHFLSSDCTLSVDR